MKLKGVTEQQLRAIVAEISQDYGENIRFKREPEKLGNFLHFTLTVNNSRAPGGRISHSGRRVSALCWHGHRDVMQRIFDRYPEAILITALARYDGAQGFEENYPGTGSINMGSQIAPMAMQNACDC